MDNILYCYSSSTASRLHSALPLTVIVGRTFLPVRPAHGKWHTSLLYAVRPSFRGKARTQAYLSQAARKPADSPCRNVCHPYFSNRLRRFSLSPYTASPHTFSEASQGLSARDIHSPYGSGAAMRRLSDSLCGGPNMKRPNDSISNCQGCA